MNIRPMDQGAPLNSIEQVNSSRKSTERDARERTFYSGQGHSGQKQEENMEKSQDNQERLIDETA